ncbi:hypothetical protein D3C76_1524080 [compost metagenome]
MNGKMIFNIVQRLGQSRKEFPSPQVNHEGYLTDLAVRLFNQFRKFRNQHRWQIIHAEKAEIFQALYRNRFACSGHARNDNERGACAR